MAVNNEKSSNEKYEDFITKSIGQFGLWQLLVVFLSSLVRLLSSWNLSSILLITPRSTYICTEFSENATILEVQTSKCYNGCTKYEFENVIFEETLTSEFELICDDKWMASFTQSVLMMGLVFGTNFLAWIADRYGRRTGLLFSITIMVISTISVSFAPTFWCFTALRFFVGIASGGIMVITTIITVETIGPKYRYLGSLPFLSDILGQATIVLFGYYANTWREMLFNSSIVSLSFLSYFFLMPESPRWLILVGRTKEAVKILTTAAKWNGLETENIPKLVESKRSSLENVNNDVSKKYGYSDLFKSKKVKARLLCGIGMWFTLGLCHYGLNQYISFIGKNIYMNIAFSGLIQVWVLLASLVSNKYVPRKGVIMGSFMMNVVLMVILTFLPKGHWIATAIAMAGLSSAVLAFMTAYIFMTEIFPTPVRNMGCGMCNASSKIGAMIAPFVANFEPNWIPSLIFAVLGLFGAFFCYFLPNIKSNKLEDNIEE